MAECKFEGAWCTTHKRWKCGDTTPLPEWLQKRVPVCTGDPCTCQNGLGCIRDGVENW